MDLHVNTAWAIDYICQTNTYLPTPFIQQQFRATSNCIPIPGPQQRLDRSEDRFAMEYKSVNRLG
jgi:hypothetical protein